jgi:hypothetical protein
MLFVVQDIVVMIIEGGNYKRNKKQNEIIKLKHKPKWNDR